MDEIFRFKQFDVNQNLCAMKVGTDAVLLGCWAQGGKRILDIGCGTGIISLMMAQRCPEAEITAIDIEADCCRQTRENADATPWADRISVVHKSLQHYSSDLLADEKGFEKFDAIISNPPFFVNSMKNPDSKRTLARHTDSLPFSTLVRGASKLLTDDGVFSVMLPNEVFKDFQDEAWFSGLYLVKDLALKTTPKKQPRRHLLLFSKQRPDEVEYEVEVLQAPDGGKSEWYVNLAKDFYL